VAATLAAAATKIEPAIDGGVILVDNINLAPPGAGKQGDVVFEVMPSIALMQDSLRMKSALNYSLQGLLYAHRSDLNGLHNAGYGNTLIVAAEDWFFVQGQADYVQQRIDPAGASNSGNLFSSSNTTDRFDGLVAPYLFHKFGETAVLLRYSAAAERFSGGGAGSAGSLLEDANTGISTAEVGSADASRLVAWSLRGRSARSTFETAAPFRTDLASAEASIRVRNDLRVLGVGGSETNITTNTVSGGLDAGFWAAGLIWTPGANQSYEVRGGHRFYGDAYSVKLNHSGRVLKMSADYSEDPTTDAQYFALLEFVPGEIDPNVGLPSTDVLRTSFEPYLRKQGNVDVALAGRRTNLTLTAYDVRRTYLAGAFAGSRDKTSGGHLALLRNLNARSSAGVSVDIASGSLRDGTHYQENGYEAHYAYKVGSNLELVARVLRIDRTGNGAAYVADVGTLILHATF